MDKLENSSLENIMWSVMGKQTAQAEKVCRSWILAWADLLKNVSVY